jgi:hypothetical protein
MSRACGYPSVVPADADRARLGVIDAHFAAMRGEGHRLGSGDQELAGAAARRWLQLRQPQIERGGHVDVTM